jgi:hypothetical protein
MESAGFLLISLNIQHTENVSNKSSILLNNERAKILSLVTMAVWTPVGKLDFSTDTTKWADKEHWSAQ